ncbi:hypothetical protein HRI_005097400 [Hibiscus trionum]|uniref:Reverse transcriptase domain-containing protein n=1 Tax=Hibiscus trionum TaxID=183268 RepID=A0A9W7JJF5_HIBTR|nr:hypothetical protein HRI_005097400 [Hibiscus trionum]
MKSSLFVTWNLRGLGSRTKRAAVRRVLGKLKSGVVLIQESKKEVVDECFISQICGRQFRFSFAFSPSEGAAGGIITVWDDSFFRLKFSIIHSKYVACVGTLLNEKLDVAIINIYAPNDVSERRRLWAELKEMVHQLNIPVLIGGDFNVIRKQSEKLGFHSNKKAMAEFDEFIEGLALIDLPLSGGEYTWCSNREEPVFCRLDRFLVDAEIISKWPNVTQNIVASSISDHKPVVLFNNIRRKEPSIFRWFDYWAEEKDYDEVIKAAADKAKGKGILNFLSQCKRESERWNRSRKVLDNECSQVLEEKMLVLEKQVQSNPGNIAAKNEIKGCRAKLWNCYRREKREWLQKSRLKWFQAGDKNTKYFHLVASARQRTNTITALKVDGELVTDQNKIKQSIFESFKEVYNDKNTIPIKKLDCNLKKLSAESAEFLDREFSEDEIKHALWAMDGSRAPGPDGFNMNFLKKYWSTIKGDVLKFFNEFYNGTISDTSFNRSFIVLIPKKSPPSTMEDYRPISLVCSMYKLVAKVLSYRVSGCIHEFISENQFAFCPGKQILDCALISNEVFDVMKKGGRPGIVFKADFRKAYDTVDWHFLLFSIKMMGFGEKWLSWIQFCISSANISILVNGLPTPSFSIQRGLRQGCPLSPILFNIVAEVLSEVLKNAVRVALFEAVNINGSDISVSHIQFADDLIVFAGASETQVQNIVRILRGFGLASGLRLNLDKSKLLGVNVDPVILEKWAVTTKCSTENFPCTYLGLPLGIVRNSLKIWVPVVEKVKKRLTSWRSRLLSFSGRLVLVKAVLSNLPIYYMSLFKLPVSICKQINRLINNFLWGGAEKRSIVWIGWKELCKPKVNGGLGLVDMKVKNMSIT